MHLLLEMQCNTFLCFHSRTRELLCKLQNSIKRLENILLFSENACNVSTQCADTVVEVLGLQFTGLRSNNNIDN